MYVYSLISHRVQQTSQFTSLVLELSLVRSHLLWGEFSAIFCSYSHSQFSIVRSTRYPSLLGGQRRHDMKGLPTPLHMADSVTRAPAVTHPSTNRAQRCLTSVIWRELVTTRPCATTYKSSTQTETQSQSDHKWPLCSSCMLLYGSIPRIDLWKGDVWLSQKGEFWKQVTFFSYVPVLPCHTQHLSWHGPAVPNSIRLSSRSSNFAWLFSATKPRVWISLRVCSFCNIDMFGSSTTWDRRQTTTADVRCWCWWVVEHSSQAVDQSSRLKQHWLPPGDVTPFVRQHRPGWYGICLSFRPVHGDIYIYIYIYISWCCLHAFI